MPTYTWSGVDCNGKKISGVDCVNNYQHLKHKLSNQNILLLKVELKISMAFWRNRKIKAKHVTAFIEQLAILINANISLITALNIIGQDETNEGLKNLIINCKNSISAGQSLHQTLCQHPQYFNELLCSLIYVGEQSGTLDIILNELASYFAKIASQKRKIIKALLYPATVLSITFIVTAILLLFVIPQFKTLYDGAGASLPSYTQFIIDLGDFVQAHWSFILSGIFSTIVCTKLFHQRSIRFRHYLDDVSLKTPIIGKILTYSIITRLTKTIGLSFKSGMPLLKAITTSSGTTQNWRYQLALQNISKSISNGKTLHGAMAEQKLFPPKVIQLIALGEETGTLDIMLEKIATIYNKELNHITDNLNNLLEPIIMLILGFLVGGLIIGMYLPIFRLGMVM
ncbi:Type IV pilus assembly protein PilC [Gammaproteobacteria bacterium]